MYYTFCLAPISHASFAFAFRWKPGFRPAMSFVVGCILNELTLSSNHLGMWHGAPRSIASYTRACQMVRKPFENQICESVDGTANLCCAICEQFAYNLLQTEICRCFVWTQRELNAPGVLFMHWVSFARFRFAENRLTVRQIRTARERLSA